VIGNRGKALGGISSFIRNSQIARQNQIAHMSRIGNAIRFARGGRRALGLEDVPNSFLGFVGTEETEDDEVLEIDTLEAQTQGFFKKMFKGIGKIIKSVGKFFKKLFKRKKASEITNSLLNSLDYGTNINLFIIKQKALMLLMFRNLQLQQQSGGNVVGNSKASCQCDNVLKYINDNLQKQGYNQKFLSEMNNFCLKQPNCVTPTAGLKYINFFKKKGRVHDAISNPNIIIRELKRDVKKSEDKKNKKINKWKSGKNGKTGKKSFHYDSFGKKNLGKKK